LTTALHHPLLCHPSQTCQSVSGIYVAAEFSKNGDLHLRYRINGAPLLPSAQSPAAADNLWQHTCCEAFVASAGEACYREFNLSPSSQWAAYRFTTYRQRDINFQPPVAPQISLTCLADGFELEAQIARELLPSGEFLEIGLTTVIESADGSKTYWALAHCAEQPDFHLRSSFTLRLPKP
jgi:hypothetical protein